MKAENVPTKSKNKTQERKEKSREDGIEALNWTFAIPQAFSKKKKDFPAHTKSKKYSL